MAIEKDRGCLDGLLLAPVDRTAIYFGKAIGNLVFMLIVEAIILPIYSILYNTNLFNPGLLLVILLGSIGYVAVGTLLASMAVQTRTRDVLLPILLVPGGHAGADCRRQSQQRLPAGARRWQTSLPWLNLLRRLRRDLYRGGVYGVRLCGRRIKPVASGSYLENGGTMHMNPTSISENSGCRHAFCCCSSLPEWCFSMPRWKP